VLDYFRITMKSSFLSFTVILVNNWIQSWGLQLTTTAKSKLSASELQDFCSRPSNWPKIVASSDKVESKDDPTMPLKLGSSVEEFFGLGLLSVTWTCEESKPGAFVVRAPDGVTGIANDCSMRFDFEDNQVKLTMGYNPISPLAILATPVLLVDNWIALNVLLPAAVDPNPLDSFRKLMGLLYGAAGFAHLADLAVGPSAILVAAGAPVFAELPPLGEAYALLWCLAGPVSFVASRSEKSQVADNGLIFYGVIEVIGAILTQSSVAFVNSIGVQAVVLAAWFYSKKGKERREQEQG
jgi:hypothetical protein